MPAQLPTYDPDALEALLQKPGPEIVAEILNRFLKTRITGLEVTFVLGRRFYRLTPIGHRLLAGELWRNSDGSFVELCKRLTGLICAERTMCTPGMWMRITCRIALTFAMFGDLYRAGLGGAPLDVAVPTGNFEAPYALWVARSMGLNVGTILCCADENSFTWDLFNRGQLRLGREPVPEALELYFHEVLGWDGSWLQELQYQRGFRSFTAEEHELLAEGFASMVVGEGRVRRAMPNLYRSCGYVLCPQGALAYAGAEDYRSRRREVRGTLVLLEQNPCASAQAVTAALNIEPGTLREWCRNG